jgi:hypothetical protein
MMAVVVVMIFIFVLAPEGADEQYAPANRRWVCATGRFNAAKPADQTKRGQLIASPISKPFSRSQNAGLSGVRSNP